MALITLIWLRQCWDQEIEATSTIRKVIASSRERGPLQRMDLFLKSHKRSLFLRRLKTFSFALCSQIKKRIKVCEMIG